MIKYSLVFFIVLLNSIAFSEVDPPNYNFSLDTFENFMPGKTLKEIQDKYGKGEVENITSNPNVYKFYVAHIRYKFPIWVQFQNGVATDFFAKLPSYFLHDIFHQSLINRYGKQQQYKKIEEQAVYIWNDVKGLEMTYSGACTITCFPIFFNVTRKEKNPTPIFETLFSKRPALPGY